MLIPAGTADSRNRLEGPVPGAEPSREIYVTGPTCERRAGWAAT